jgi:hypothetical protein
MALNRPYRGPADLPAEIAVFPLPAALLLPRGEMPLNVFEPRYLAMVDDALRGERLIGMIQPEPETAEDAGPSPLAAVGCVGRLTAFQETGDGRYLVTLTGVARFAVVEELASDRPYRRCRVDFGPFAGDFRSRAGEDEVDRAELLATFRAYLDANDLQADWSGVDAAPTEALVNALAMMAPYGPREKQALLEAATLRDRAAMLVALTERVLARAASPAEPRLN